MAREIRYIKPNMNNLKGKTGRIILEQIRNVQTDDSYLKETVAKAKADILARLANEK